MPGAARWSGASRPLREGFMLSLMYRRSRLVGLRILSLSALSFALGAGSGALAYQSPAYDRGCAEMSRGDWDGAIISFGEVIGFDMNNLDAYMKRGKCFYHLNNFKEAIGDFSHILDNNPSNVDALLWRGTVNARIGNHEASVRDYLAAIRSDPSLAKKFEAGSPPAASTDVQQGQVLKRGFGNEPELRSGPKSAAVGTPENQGAVKDYERAMALFLNQRQTDELPAQSSIGARGEDLNDRAPDEVAKPGTGSAQARQRRHKEGLGEKGASDSMAAGKPLPESDEDLGKGGGAGSVDKAAVRARIAKLNNALELDDRNPQLIYRRGLLYERLLNFDQALSDYSRAINLSPMEASYYLARARTYHNLDQPDLEQDDIKKAQSIDPLLPKKIRFVDRSESHQRENHNFKNPVE